MKKIILFASVLFQLPSGIFFLVYLLFAFFFDTINHKITYEGDLSNEEEALKTIIQRYVLSKRHIFDRYKKHINSIFWIIVALLILF